jgi:hypothetical protein
MSSEHILQELARRILPAEAFGKVPCRVRVKLKRGERRFP